MRIFPPTPPTVNRTTRHLDRILTIKGTNCYLRQVFLKRTLRGMWILMMNSVAQGGTQILNKCENWAVVSLCLKKVKFQILLKLHIRNHCLKKFEITQRLGRKQAQTTKFYHGFRMVCTLIRWTPFQLSSIPK